MNNQLIIPKRRLYKLINNKHINTNIILTKDKTEVVINIYIKIIQLILLIRYINI